MLLPALALVFVAACNGGSDGAVTGYLVKGPVQHARVTVYALDPSKTDGQGTSLATGRTDAQSQIENVAVPPDTRGILLITFGIDSTTRDITTGRPPALDSAVTVVGARDVIDRGQAVYATPLTTMATRIALARAGDADFGGDGQPPVTNGEMLSALDTAASLVADMLGLGLLDGVAMFTTPPLLIAGETDAADEQRAVARHRTAIEAVAALVARIGAAIDSANGAAEGTTTVAAAFDLITADLTDGVLDGFAEDETLTGYGADGLAAAARVLRDAEPGRLPIPDDPEGRTVRQSPDILRAEISATGNAGAATDAVGGADTVTLAASVPADRDQDGVLDSNDAFPDDPDRTEESDDGSTGDGDTGGDGSGSTAADVYAAALDRWETNMAERGAELGEKLLTTPTSELNALPRAWYYDSQRAFFQIADRLGDPDDQWEEYAQGAEAAYEAYVRPDYEMPGFERHPHGLGMDYLRNGDSSSRTTLRNLRDQGPFADVLTSPFADGWFEHRSSREVAYMIETHVMAERAGMPRQAEALEAYVVRALEHIDIWTTGDFRTDDPDWQFVQSFMTGLTASALIDYYELTVTTGAPDERVPEAIRTLGDWLIANMWVPEHALDGTYPWIPETYGSFKFVVPATDGVGSEEPAPDLNLLIVPMFGWLYQETGDLTYRDVGDKAFAGGVAFAWLVPDKTFNQNYRTSFKYVDWRGEGNAKWGN